MHVLESKEKHEGQILNASLVLSSFPSLRFVSIGKLMIGRRSCTVRGRCMPSDLKAVRDGDYNRRS